MRSRAVPLLLSLTLFPAIAPTPAAARPSIDSQAVPQPFPKPATPGGSSATQPPQSPARPATPGGAPPATAPAAAAEPAPTEATLGAPIYPDAQFLASYNAGQGQRYYLFGSTASFAEVVNFYRTSLRQRGEVVFDEPATHMFEVGRFREETMAFPPGVTVKDYTWGNLGGYLNPKAGAQPARYPTVIQMVPAPTAAGR